jgi:PEGA domain
MKRPKPPEKPEKPRRPLARPVAHQTAEQEIQIDADRWTAFRDSFGEREFGIDADGTPIELLRLAREFSAVEGPIAERVTKLRKIDQTGVARSYRVEHDDDKRRPRSVLVSDRIPGVRLSDILARGTSRGVVPDIGAALYVMRRLYKAAEKLRKESGLSHFILGPERVVVTPRGEVVIVEAALASGIDALAASGAVPKTLKLAFSDSNSIKHGLRLDIARIARIGVAMLVGRTIDADETIDALSPILGELNDVAAIRAGDEFSAALRTWLEQALTIEAGVSFDDFGAAAAALEQTNPPNDCVASRRTFRGYLETLQIDEFAQSDLTTIEIERLRAIRTRQTMSRSGQRRGWVNRVAGELGLPHKDEVLQESPAEIAAKPLAPRKPRPPVAPAPASPRLAADKPVSPPPATPAPPAPPVETGEPLKDSVIKAVASRFGFLLQEEGQKAPAGSSAPAPQSGAEPLEARTVPPPAIETPPAAASASALVIEHTSMVEPPVVLEHIHTPSASEVTPLQALSQLEIPQPATSWQSSTSVAPPASETPAVLTTAPVELAEQADDAPTEEPVEVKRPKKSWFRSVAKQFGLAGDGKPGLETSSETADSSDLAAEASREAEILAEEEGRRLGAEHDRLAAEAEAQRSAESARRLAVEQEGRRAAEEQVRRLGAEAEAQRAAEADALRVAAEAEIRTLAAEAEARRAAEEEARRLAAEAEARRKAEEEARRAAAEAEARRVAEAEARRVAAEAEARRKAEEAARRKAEAEARRKAEEEARRKAEEETRRRAEEEARRLAAEAEARRKAEEEARRLAAEIEARRRAEEEARRLAAEADARRAAAEAEAKRLAAEAEARRVAAEAETRRLVDERARQQLALEAQARRAAEEAERLAAEAEEADGVEEEVDDEPDEESSRDAWLKSVAAEMGLRPDPDKAPASSAPAWDHDTPPVGMKRPQEWQPPPPPVRYTPSGPPANAPSPPSVAAPPRPVAPPPPPPPPMQPPQFPWQTPTAAQPPPRGEHVSLQQMTPSVRYEDAGADVEPEPSRLEKVTGGGGSLFKLVAILAVVVGLAGAGYAFWSSRVKPGAVSVESNPSGAEVFVDGESRGMTPITLSLPPGPHKLELRRRGASREIALDVKAGEQASQQIDLTNIRAVGTLVVNSNPKGAKVIVDGRDRGVTPLTLTDMSVGAHKVVLQGAAGTISKDVQVQAGSTVNVDEGIFSGWIAVFAPFDIQVYEGRRQIGSTDQERIMMPAGRHELQFVNTQRGFRESRTIEVGPGATLPVNIEKTEGTLRIDAPEGSEVFIDGASVGRTPIGEQTVTIGIREIVVNHPQLGEKKLSATVTSSAPAEVKVEFTP